MRVLIFVDRLRNNRIGRGVSGELGPRWIFVELPRARVSNQRLDVLVGFLPGNRHIVRLPRTIYNLLLIGPDFFLRRLSVNHLIVAWIVVVIVKVFSRQLIVQNEHFWIISSLFLQLFHKIHCWLASVMCQRSAFFWLDLVVFGREALLFDTVAILRWFSVTVITDGSRCVVVGKSLMLRVDWYVG